VTIKELLRTQFELWWAAASNYLRLVTCERGVSDFSDHCRDLVKSPVQMVDGVHAAFGIQEEAEYRKSMIWAHSEGRVVSVFCVTTVCSSHGWQEPSDADRSSCFIAALRK
jgi:hypothetical protein